MIEKQSGTSLEIFDLGLVEILGDLEAFTFSQGLETTANAPESKAELRGIAIRAGRSSFYYWLRNFQVSFGWEDPMFRLLPTKKKFLTGLTGICSWLSGEMGTSLKLIDQENTWEISNDIPVDEPGLVRPLQCEYLLGFFQEFTRWAGQGRLYQVKEVTCAKMGKGTCTFSISKFPVD